MMNDEKLLNAVETYGDTKKKLHAAKLAHRQAAQELTAVLKDCNVEVSDLTDIG